MASMSNDLQGQPGELRATIHITRKATGLTETHELILTPKPENEDVSNTHDSGEKRGD